MSFACSLEPQILIGCLGLRGSFFVIRGASTVGSNKEIYKITLTNWAKYNKHARRSHKALLLDFNFVTDAKVRTLSMTSRWVLLNLIVTCSDQCRDTVELSSNRLRELLECNRSIVGTLSELQSLQLLTFEIVNPFMNRIEVKRKEVKGNEVPTGSQATPAGKAEIDSTKSQNKRVNDAYCQSYFDRYKVQPVSNAKHNSAVAQLVKRLGVDDAISVVKFFLRHNESYYVRNTHTIGLCLKDCETLRTQMLKGVSITRGKMKHFEREQEHQDMLDLIERENHEPTATN